MPTPPADPRTPDRSSPLPLWAQVHDDLLRRLRAGEFATAVPAESALMAQYGVSRHTVREALRRLRDSGVVESGRGHATRVRRLEQPLGHLYSLFRSVEEQGMVQLSTVLRQEITTDAAAAGALGLPAGEPLVHIERVRHAGDQPLAHDRTWLPAGVAGALVEADLSRAALYGELARRCGVHLDTARERITAMCPDARLSELLELGPDTAVLQVERLGLSAGRPLEHRVTRLRGDRFALTTESTAAGQV